MCVLKIDAAAAWNCGDVSSGRVYSRLFPSSVPMIAIEIQNSYVNMKAEKETAVPDTSFDDVPIIADDDDDDEEGETPIAALLSKFGEG